MAKCVNANCTNNTKKGSKSGLCKFCSEKNPTGQQDVATSTAAATKAPAANAANGAGVSVASDTTAPAVTETTDSFFLRFSMVARPFRLPGYTEIANAALEYFQDPTLKVSMRRMGPEKIYRIKLKHKSAKDGRSLKLVCNDTELTFPLLTENPFKKGEKREDGILLPFQRANEDEMECIPNDVFDGEVGNFKLEVIRPTELQKVPGSPALNGNRYCVIKPPEDLNKIPEFLPVRNPLTKSLHNVKTTYKGQARFCTRCLKKHVGECPELKAFYEALEKRNKLKEDGEIVTKFMSDSTLRLVDPLGIKAEVSTMSGGGLGQIAQATIDDPENTNMTNLFIIGGANDIKNNKFESNEEFAENVEGSMEKIVIMAKENPLKEITLVNSQPKVSKKKKKKNGVVPPVYQHIDTSIRQLYLHRSINNIVENLSLKNLHVMDISYETDETSHPSDIGTKQILDALDKHCNNRLIWDTNYTIAKRIYSCVETIYRYGCNHCTRYGSEISHEQMNNLLCDDCHLKNKERAKEKSYPLLDEIVAEMNEIHNGSFSDEDNEDDGETSRKKSRPNEDANNKVHDVATNEFMETT